jgi:hypothetical protein
MIKVINIIKIQSKFIDCELNNGIKKRITLGPLFKKTL